MAGTSLGVRPTWNNMREKIMFRPGPFVTSLSAVTALPPRSTQNSLGGGEWIREKAGWASTGGGWICPVCPVATRRYVFSEGRDERREVENFQVRWQFETCQIGRPTLPDLRCLSRACGMAELLLSLTLNVIWRGLHYPTWVSSTTSSIQSTPQICFLNIL